jgi:hypothetical protein
MAKAVFLEELNGCVFEVRNPAVSICGAVTGRVRVVRQPGDRLYERRRPYPAERAAVLTRVGQRILARRFAGACAGCGYRDPGRATRCPNCGTQRSSLG